MTPLHTAFQHAYEAYLVKKGQGIDAKKPKMYFPDFHITRAPDTGKNRGFLYIKDNTPYPDTTYLGKIAPNGKFLSSSPMKENELELLSELIDTAVTNPLELTQEVGKETGTCCCCGRHLTNPLSVQLGIGPICRGGWFPDATLADLEEIDLGELTRDIDGTVVDDTTKTEELRETIEEIDSKQADLENFYDVDKIKPGQLIPISPGTNLQDVADSVYRSVTATNNSVDFLYDQYLDLDSADRIVFLSRISIHEVTKS